MIPLPNYKLLLYEVDNTSNRRELYIQLMLKYVQQPESLFRWFCKLSKENLQKIHLRKKRSGIRVYISLIRGGLDENIVYRYKRSDGSFSYTVNKALDYRRFH